MRAVLPRRGHWRVVGQAAIRAASCLTTSARTGRRGHHGSNPTGWAAVLLTTGADQVALDHAYRQALAELLARSSTAAADRTPGDRLRAGNHRGDLLERVIEHSEAELPSTWGRRRFWLFPRGRTRPSRLGLEPARRAVRGRCDRWSRLSRPLLLQPSAVAEAERAHPRHRDLIQISPLVRRTRFRLPR